MNLIAAWPRYMRPEVAMDYVGGRAVLDSMLEQKLLKPKEKNPRFTIYDRFALDAACDAWRGFDPE